MPDQAPSGSPLSLEAVSLWLGPQALIADLSLRVAPGEVATVMGPSGSGKSTLLAFLTGTLDRAFRATGAVRLGEVDLTHLRPEHRRVGILFQDDLLFPHLSVGENLAFGLHARHRDRRQRERLVAQALDEAGLPGFEDRDPATLSGGQRSRVALMRTLLAEPAALLLDEPFNKLDARLRADFRSLVFAHVARRRLPTLLVTHDPDDAQAAAGPVILLAEAS
jgi:putative thiamine transport system ATP-binding protein